MQFQHTKLDHYFVLILYNFVHQVPNFVQRSFLRYAQFKFGGAGEMQPPEMQFQYKKLDYNFGLILYTFVHQAPNFVPCSFIPYPQFKFGGW